MRRYLTIYPINHYKDKPIILSDGRVLSVYPSLTYL